MYGATLYGAYQSVVAAVGVPVTHDLGLPDGTIPRRADIAIRLAGKGYPWTTIEGSVGVLSVGGIARPQVDSTGTWTASLIPNALLSPAGTVYEVRERFGGRESILFISVGLTGGRVPDLLASAPV